jgi:hypothetical protein
MKPRRSFDVPSFVAGMAVVALGPWLLAHGAPLLAWLVQFAGLADGHDEVGSASAVALAGLAALSLVVDRGGRRAAPRDFRELRAQQTGAFPFLDAEIPDRNPLDVTGWLEASTGHPAPWHRVEVEAALAAQLPRGLGGGEGLMPHEAVLLAYLGGRALRGDSRAIDADGIASAWRHAARSAEDYASATASTERAVAAWMALSEPQAWLEKLSLSHGWTTTLLMGALADARRRGVVAESEFSWLAAVDWQLAMALNSVGRPSFLPEGLGAAVHFAAERDAGHALAKPEVSWGAAGVAAHLRRNGSYA